MEVSRRYRVNVSTTAKGIKTFDCTVEVATDEKLADPESIKNTILGESDALVKELDQRYPPPKE